MIARWHPLDRAERLWADSVQELRRRGAEWATSAQATDSARGLRVVAGASALAAVRYSAYLAIRGVRTPGAFQQDLIEAIDFAVAVDAMEPGLGGRLAWFEVAAAAGQLGRLARIRWSGSWREPAEQFAENWWEGVARGDASACRSARDELRRSRRRFDSSETVVRPALAVGILDALDAGDERGLQAGLERLLDEHDERAHPRPDNVVGCLSLTIPPLLACWPAMAFIAEARRRRMRVSVASPYLPPGFGEAGAGVGDAPRRPRRSTGVVLNASDILRWLAQIERQLATSTPDATQPGEHAHAWDYVVELAMRRADFLAGLVTAGADPMAAACATRKALHDVASFVPRAAEQLASHGWRGAPAWMLAIGVEAELIVSRGAAPATESLAPSPVSVACVDEACMLAMRSLARRDDAVARLAAERLRSLSDGIDDVPHVRRFPPALIAMAIDAISGADASALRDCTDRLLEWHVEHAAPRPKGSRHARTPELFMVSWTALALTALARARGMEFELTHPHAPMQLLLHDCRNA